MTLPATYAQRRLLYRLTGRGAYFGLPLTQGSAGEEIRILLARKNTKRGQK